jgi:hypothetical protein
LEVVAKTPQGGFQGASTSDLDNLTAAIFSALYGEAEWTRTGTRIVYQGGLVDETTGEDLPDAITGTYSITRRQASRIDWSDEDKINYVIQWSHYRDFAHPAHKQD